MSTIYETFDPIKALQFNKMALAYKDSLENPTKTAAFETSLTSMSRNGSMKLRRRKTAYRNRVSEYELLTGLGFFLLIALILYWNNK